MKKLFFKTAFYVEKLLRDFHISIDAEYPIWTDLTISIHVL